MKISKITRALFFLIGGIWIVLGVVSFFKAEGGRLNPSNAARIIAILMFANASVLLWIGWRIKEGGKGTYILGITVLVVNILLTVMDEFGSFDLVTLLIDITLLVLLIATRSRYTSPE